jgi:hypothetical protein
LEAWKKIASPHKLSILSLESQNLHSRQSQQKTGVLLAHFKILSPSVLEGLFARSHKAGVIHPENLGPFLGYISAFGVQQAFLDRPLHPRRDFRFLDLLGYLKGLLLFRCKSIAVK